MQSQYIWIHIAPPPHKHTHTHQHERCYIVQHAVRGRVKNEELSGEKHGEAQPGKGEYNSSDQWLQIF